MENKIEEEYSINKLVRNEVNCRIWKIKEEYREAYTNKPERGFYGIQKQVWQMIRNQKKEIK